MPFSINFYNMLSLKLKGSANGILLIKSYFVKSSFIISFIIILLFSNGSNQSVSLAKLICLSNSNNWINSLLV